MPKRLPVFVALSLGPEFGIFVMNDKVNADPSAGKSKFDYTESYIKMFSGDEKLISQQKAYLLDSFK